ncbi:MAG: hypothetical protein U5K30_14905 [Acidimicrobiales bacterium]|nr:hypothetical protein [Acidimicrobiales bacterium]
MSGPVHLAKRFFGSLSPRPLDPVDDVWVREVLGSGERALWERMPLADRKHAARVAREVDRLLGGADRPVLAAALLHDVGKIESGLGTFGRVVATAVGAAAGRDRAHDWGRIGTYLRHPQIGEALLRDAGADDLTATWAREHHQPPRCWTMPADVGTALSSADDD